jgi:hypothetical protein
VCYVQNSVGKLSAITIKEEALQKKQAVVTVVDESHVEVMLKSATKLPKDLDTYVLKLLKLMGVMPAEALTNKVIPTLFNVEMLHLVVYELGHEQNNLCTGLNEIASPLIETLWPSSAPTLICTRRALPETLTFMTESTINSTELLDYFNSNS